MILKASKPKISKLLAKAPENPVTLGEKIKKRRIELELFQKELAEIIGVTEDCITLWEKGKSKPSKRYREKIEKFIEINQKEQLPI
ncbi:MAG TPA: helix-turn-helix transcriptional regulator [Bacteroidia bacterium]